jgi:hypothetical protein
MIDMGLDFKAPRKTNAEAWEILRLLAQNGFTFHGCGCSVGFVPPKKLREVPQWLAERHRQSKGEELIARIDELTKTRRENRKAKLVPKFKVIG